MVSFVSTASILKDAIKRIDADREVDYARDWVSREDYEKAIFSIQFQKCPFHGNLECIFQILQEYKLFLGEVRERG